MEVKIRNVFRSGSVIGIPVQTPDHKKLGEIQEVVIDVETGRVAYAVLCFGGFFGFGDKFFAVPWEEFSLVHDESEMFFVVDTTREKLKKLQGFSLEEWPDVANTDWDKLIVHNDDDSESDEGKYDEVDYDDVEDRDDD